MYRDTQGRPQDTPSPDKHEPQFEFLCMYMLHWNAIVSHTGTLNVRRM